MPPRERPKVTSGMSIGSSYDRAHAGVVVRPSGQRSAVHTRTVCATHGLPSTGASTPANRMVSVSDAQAKGATRTQSFTALSPTTPTPLAKESADGLPLSPDV